MPKQKGIIPITGTTGNTTFYKTKDGFGMRAKGGVDANRILNDPNFQRTRENGHEFGRAGSAGKVLRNALKTVMVRVADPRVVTRMSRLFNRVIKTDRVNRRGERTVLDGELGFFKGFEFNINSPMSTTLYAEATGVIDRASGAATVSIPAMIPDKFMAKPPGATHYILTAVGAEVDFVAGSSVNAMQATAELPLNDAEAPAVSLVLNLPAASDKPLFLALCIEFVQEVNGRYYGLSTGQFNAMSMLVVDTAA
ncbi:hypothetical protein ACWKWU_13530 [Chitinophaga lutea]